MAIEFLDNIELKGSLTITGSVSAENFVVEPNKKVVQSPSTITNGISGISNIVVLDQVSYDTLSPKLSTTLYVIV